eukprot:TRINITY_DN27827_c0_g1_i1.p1 TRINITY_DN27827_c0_g1~~TRINITY_DN27827_c0_g1_i1.p1  ORF type:complete len:199 (+),score=46.00 TRINITY_DN27827_c0_g1_i1:70-666(+)
MKAEAVTVVKQGRLRRRLRWADVTPLGMALLPLAGLVWALLLPRYAQLLGLGAACGFAAAEFLWHTVSTEYSDGSVRFTPFASTCRRGRTTLSQFGANALAAPLFVIPAGSVAAAAAAAAPRPLQGAAFVAASAAVAPPCVWALELAQDRALRLSFGFNPAWDYSHCSDARFGGAIRTGHWPLWVVLGVAAGLARVTL